MKDKQTEKTNEDRRSFLRKAGTMAVTAPAAGLILNAATTPAYAAVASGQFNGGTTIPTQSD